MKEIYDSAFGHCVNLKIIHLDDECEASLYEAAISDSTTIDFPRETTVGSMKLLDLRNCKQVVIPAGIEKIGNRWFCNSGIESVEIPASVREIGVDAFFRCKNLKSVVFAPESKLEKIGAGCFSDTGVEKITIPKSVTEIEEVTFFWCKKLKKVVFEDGNELGKIGNNCFRYSGLEEITLPKMLKKFGWDVFSDCENLRSIYVEDGCEACLFGTGILDSTLVSPLPEAIVGSQRAWDLRKCKHVVIPEGTERIGNHWFYGCGIESVEIPASVKYIDACAFCDC